MRIQTRICRLLHSIFKATLIDGETKILPVFLCKYYLHFRKPHLVVQADKYFSEQTMAELIKEGSLKAFNILYDKYAPALFGAIIRITGEQTIAENILQQTFIELWNNKQTYTPLKEKVFTWMFKTARRLAIENLRTQNSLDQNLEPSMENLNSVAT